MDLTKLMKLKGAWDSFTANHPKFPAFAGEIRRRGIREGIVIDISFRYPDDSTVRTNIKVSESDVELLNTLLK